MTTSNLRHLLDEATENLPASVQQAPLSSIHTRIRRRRANHAIGALSALVLATATLVPLLNSQSPLAPAAGTALPWSVAELDKNGRDVIVLTGRSGPVCAGGAAITASVSETTETVTITLTAAVPETACSAVRVPLNSPLRGRALADGSTHEHRAYYRHTDRPGGIQWTTVAPGKWQAPLVTDAAFTWELRAEPFAGFNINFSGEFVTLPLGGVMSPAGPSSYKVVWPMRDSTVATWVVYELTLIVPSGQTISSDQFKSALELLTWP